METERCRGEEERAATEAADSGEEGEEEELEEEQEGWCSFAGGCRSGCGGRTADNVEMSST